MRVAEKHRGAHHHGVSVTWTLYAVIKPCRELAPALEALLGVLHVWCDSRSQESSQRFVLWAGYVLESRCALRAAPALPHSTHANPLFCSCVVFLNIDMKCW